MASCVNCKSTPVSSNCVRVEQDFSFEHEEELNDVLHKIDDGIQGLDKILKKKIDKKWIESEREYVTDYIQDLVNKVGQLSQSLSTTKEKKFIINSSFTNGEYTDLQLFTILIKKVEDLQKQINNDTSSIYIR